MRQAGNLVEKLKKKHNGTEVISSDSSSTQQSHSEPPFPEVSEANAELVRTGAKLSLEDMEADNFTLLSENYEYNNSHNENPQTSNISSSQGTNTNLVYPKQPGIIDTNLDELIDSIPNIDKNMPSPSEILKNLCLSKEEDYICILQEQADDKNYELYNQFGAIM